MRFPLHVRLHWFLRGLLADFRDWRYSRRTGLPMGADIEEIE